MVRTCYVDYHQASPRRSRYSRRQYHRFQSIALLIVTTSCTCANRSSGWCHAFNALCQTYRGLIVLGLIYIKNESHMYRFDRFSRVDQATNVYSAVLEEMP
jgi:hypothetical protein